MTLAGHDGARLLLSAAVLISVPLAAQKLRYDAQVAWFQAGTLDLSLQRKGDCYQLSGTVATGGAMDRFLKWRGRFAATGCIIDGFPRTVAYLLIEQEGEEREVLLAFHGKTTIHRTDRESREVEQPPGSDLMSVLFLATHCLEEATVHDGEDAYGAILERASEGRLRQRPPYFSGMAKRCDYRFRYRNGRTRRIALWVSDHFGHPLPVRLRVRVPLLPDGILRLRHDWEPPDNPGGQEPRSGSRSVESTVFVREGPS